MSGRELTFTQTLAAWAIGRMQSAFKLKGAQWLWPPGIYGNGDRGPPGTWQMNRNPAHTASLTAFSAVYACVNTIASDIAKLPVQIFELEDDGSRTLLRGDYYAELMRSPNNYQTAADFIQTYVQSYLLQGNAYAYVGKRNGRGEITEMHVLNPHRVKPLIYEESGAIFYECAQDYLAGLNNHVNTIPERDIVHHRLPLLPGYPLIGVTPIFAASASAALGIQILAESQQFFANSSRPSGLLSTDQMVDEDTAKRMTEKWNDAYRGAEYGKTALLSGGMKWQPLTITAQDAQLIEQLRYSVEDVARVFRVPPFMLGDMTKVSYRNTEQLARAYLTNCVGWHIEALQQRFARAFDFPSSFELRFDLSAFLRTEIDIRFAAYNQALTSGWKSINEVRADEGLPPVEGGEEPRVQMQYVPLSQADGPPEPAPAPGAPAPGEDPPAEEDPAEEDPADAEDDQASIDPARVRRLLRDRLEGRHAA